MKNSKNKKIAINIENASKRYFLRSAKAKKKETFFALKDINIKIFKGEKVAILGDNGAGKTTLLKVMTGIAEPTCGKVNSIGKLVSLIDITAGFHPEFSGRENIYFNGILLGMNLSSIKKLEQEIINFSGIEKFIDQALYTYSSGMVLRLGFSIAIHSDPDILILDEEVVVGDQDFQKKAYDEIEKIFAEGKTIVVCSHVLPLLSRLCERFIWLDKGKVKMDGGKEVVIEYKKNRSKLDIEKIGKIKNEKKFFQFLQSLPIGERFIVEAVSGSMEPLILKGDEVRVERCSLKNIRVGNIIAYWSDEFKNIIVHRLYKKSSKGIFLTRGDSNYIVDEMPVTEDIFLGKVINF